MHGSPTIHHNILYCFLLASILKHIYAHNCIKSVNFECALCACAVDRMIIEHNTVQLLAFCFILYNTTCNHTHTHTTIFWWIGLSHSLDNAMTLYLFYKTIQYKGLIINVHTHVTNDWDCAGFVYCVCRYIYIVLVRSQCDTQ